MKALVILLSLWVTSIDAKTITVKSFDNNIISLSKSGVVEIYSQKNDRKNHFYKMKLQNFSDKDYADELASPQILYHEKNSLSYKWSKEITESWKIISTSFDTSIERRIKLQKPKTSKEQLVYSLQTSVETDLDFFYQDKPSMFQDIDNKLNNDLIIDERMISIVDKNCKQLAVKRNYDDINRQMTYHFNISQVEFPLIFTQFIQINPQTKPQQVNKVAIDGNFVVVSYKNPTALKIYKKEAAGWKFFQAITPSFAKGFGDALALDGNTLAIASPFETNNGNQKDIKLEKFGSVYIYSFTNDRWRLENKLSDQHKNTMEGYFGSSLYLKNNTLLVSAPKILTYQKKSQNKFKINNVQGAVFLFTKENNKWLNEATFFPQKNSNESAFGKSIAINKNILIIGGNYIDKNHFYNINRKSRFNQEDIDFGQFYIYEFVANKWQMQKHFKLHDINPYRPRDSDITFANSLDISDDGEIFVSAPGKTWAYIGKANLTDSMDGQFDEAGYVAIFKKKNKAWKLNKILKSRFPSDWDHFGNIIKIVNNTVFIGADGESSSSLPTEKLHRNCEAYSSGAAFIFEHKLSGWNLTNFFKSDSPTTFEKFSHVLDFDGENAIVATNNKLFIYSKHKKKWRKTPLQ